MVEKTLECFYKKKQLYAVTISPDDKHQFFYKSDRLKKFINLYNELTVDLKTIYKIDYYFKVELSEPRGEISSQGPRLHLHGWIYMPYEHSVFKFLEIIMPRLLQHARLEITQLNDYESWDKYIHKQSHIFKQNNTISNLSENIHKYRPAGAIRQGKNKSVSEGGEPL